jgi:uncharacterized protein involved in response to NO
MTWASSPLWLVGFRPFFILACLSGALLPAVWALVFSGHGALTASPVDPLRWHAHEMFFGFGWAVLGGFLLTATKNWVNVRGYHGQALALLALAWLLERYAMAFGSGWPRSLQYLASHLFLGSIVGMLLFTLIRHRQRDSYRDNAVFIVLLPAFLIAKDLLLYGDFAAGSAMSLALFRLSFLVMLERTLTAFMQGAFQLKLPRHPGLDWPIKLLGLALVGGFLLPAALTANLSLALAALLLYRFTLWQPRRAMRRIDIGIMYLGTLAIMGELLLSALAHWITPPWIGAVPTHVFTLGAMGGIIPAMIIRIANGHTGRKVVFAAVDRGILYLMLLGLALRVGLPQLAPSHYPTWVLAAAACWLLGFGLLAWRYTPILLQPRIDGREH